MVASLLKRLAPVLAFVYGLITIFQYACIAIFRGTFFKSPSEREELELLLARDRFWNLSENPMGLTHQFITLGNGFKLHYVSNDRPEALSSSSKKKPVVIFLHGFPDSWAIWRHLLTSTEIQQGSTIIAPDLPGYGGTDSLPRYGATEVLETLTEFIIAVRERYGVDGTHASEPEKKVIVVAHDWGAALAFRLAAEAPQLADRFIVTNGNLVSLTAENISLSLDSSMKMFKTFLREPWRSLPVLRKAFLALKPVLRQLKRSEYIFAFHLPIPLVRYLGTGGNYSFLKQIHKLAAGTVGEYTMRDAQDSMASTLGPGVEECKTMTADQEQYSESVSRRAKSGNFIDITSYYREGAARGTWHKSLETISALHNIWPYEPRRTSSGTGVFDPAPASLKANATVIWGKEDPALDSHLALEGIANYLVRGSQVIVLPRSGHFTPLEVESRRAVQKAVEWAIQGEKGDVGSRVASVYPDAVAVAQK